MHTARRGQRSSRRWLFWLGRRARASRGPVLQNAKASQQDCITSNPGKQQEMVENGLSGLRGRFGTHGVFSYFAPRPDSITLAVSKIVTRSSVMERCLM